MAIKTDMTKTFLTGLAALTLLSVSAETLQRSFYFDFGVTGRSNATAVVNPDGNGNYWNNIGAEVKADPWRVSKDADYLLITADNQTTAMHLTYTGDLFLGNGAGGLSTPDAEKLGDLAVENATRDYLFASNSERCGFVISGLDATKAYQFEIFGSRAAKDNRVSKYDIEGLTNTTGQLQAAGTNLGGTGVNQNNSRVYLSEMIFPDKDGKITIYVSKGTSGQYLPINCMRMQEFSGVTPPVVVKYESLTLKGTGVEGNTIDMYRIAKDGETESQNFETFCMLTNGGTIAFETAEGKALYSGTVSEETGIYNVRFNTQSAEPEFVKITRCGLVGNVTTAMWNAAGVAMTYRGNGVWRDTLDLVPHTGSDAERGQFCFNSSWDLTVKTRNNVEGIVGYKPDESLASISLGDIPMRHGKKIVILDMQHFTYSLECVDIADNKITFFGSSVCNGQGASEVGNVKHGYAWQLGQLLTGYEYSNASINGNNTTNLLSRYKGHLLADCGRYVVIGLGLGNEGIHGAANPQAIYNQWKTNMQTLIDLFEAEGKYVIATNNYPRGDYNATDYAYVKKMNLEMHEWNIPTVNFLGALDNCQGNGQWADGYQNGDDIYHPNETGHTEFMHTFVPSLFDALAAGKPMPTRQNGEGLHLTPTETLEFSPEAAVGSYTIVVRVKTTTAGMVAKLRLDGMAKPFALPAAAADGNWHTLVISHYQAAGQTYTYLDGKQMDKQEDKSILGEVVLGGIDMQVNDLMFYRSALNADEVAAIETGKLLRSSLEIYCPLNNDDLTNVAQSTNTITRKGTPSSLENTDNDYLRAESFDVLGRTVNADYRGIVIQAGNKVLR